MEADENKIEVTFKKLLNNRKILVICRSFVQKVRRENINVLEKKKTQINTDPVI